MGTDAGASSCGGGSDASADAGSSAPGKCFASGLNVPWVNFANDVPNPDIATFRTLFTNTYAAGGRIVRWWFHTNGTVTPGYQSNGLVQTMPASHLSGVRSILDAAHAAGVQVNISLWSFDMLQSNESGLTSAVIANNRALLENDTNRQAYIDNYLTPLVTALKGYPGLYSWEVFNEPEGMGPNGWSTGARTTEAAIRRSINWLAAAIHDADPSALVTSGAVTFDYCSNVPGKTNDYSDAALVAAGGKANGTLDFYEVHYYAQNGASNSAFTNPASHWALDKPLVMGEFFAQATDGVATDALYTTLFDTGYNGGWAWSYESDVKWPAMQAPMQALSNADESSLCP